MKLRAACVVFGFLSLAQLTFAQSTAETASALPRLVRFGGTVKDLNGNPLAGVVGITFALYSEQTGGAALWLETQNVTADGNGHYVALLGSTKPDGLPVELFTSEQARWVGVQVSGEAEQPRVLLVSTPYALKAGDAETIGGFPPSAFLLAAPQARQGFPPGPKKAAVAASSPSSGTGSGITNFVPLWTSSSNLGISELYQLNARVGVGTTAPGAKLDVLTGNPIATRSTSLYSGGGTGLYGISSATTGAGVGVIGEAHSARGTAGVFNNVGGGKVLSGQTNGREIFSVNATGVTQIGVQSTTPTGILNASSSSAAYAGLTATGWPPFETIATASTDGIDAFGGTAANQGLAGAAGVVGTGGLGDKPSAAGGPGVVGNGAAGSSGGGPGVIGNGSTSGDSAAPGVEGLGGDGNWPSHGGAGLYGLGGATLNGLGNLTDGDGVFASNPDGGTAATGGYAGDFKGDINVSGAIYAGTKDFKIDHPLDPANKYLLHASVESSEMMDIYSGNASLDANGETIVELPIWFEAINNDCRYQLTAIGAPSPGLYVAQEISDNRFEIAGGRAGGKVSWQITAVRRDVYARAHPLVVEPFKDAAERGYYIHPELYGAPEEKGIAWARHKILMRELKLRRAKHSLPKATPWPLNVRPTAAPTGMAKSPAVMQDRKTK